MHLHFWVQILKGIPQFRKRSHQMIVYLEKISRKKTSKNHVYPEPHGPPFTSGCFNWMMNQFFTEEIGCISPFPPILDCIASGYQVHRYRTVLPKNGWKKTHHPKNLRENSLEDRPPHRQVRSSEVRCTSPDRRAWEVRMAKSTIFLWLHSIIRYC